MVLRAPAQPMPVSPSPWRKMRVAVCFLADLSTTGGTPTFMLTSDETELLSATYNSADTTPDTRHHHYDHSLL